MCYVFFSNLRIFAPFNDTLSFLIPPPPPHTHTHSHLLQEKELKAVNMTGVDVDPEGQLGTVLENFLENLE